MSQVVTVECETYIFKLVGVETVVSSEHEPPGDPVMLLTASTPLLLLQISLGQNLLGHVQLGPDTHSLHHIVRLGDAQLECLVAPLGHADHLGVREVQDVDPVDGEEDVADSQAGALGGGARLDGRDDDGPGAVDTETKLALHSLHSDSLVAFCNISILDTISRKLPIQKLKIRPRTERGCLLKCLTGYYTRWFTRHNVEILIFPPKLNLRIL